MTTSHTAVTYRARWRRIAAGALAGSALAVGLAFSGTPIAAAEPYSGEWDLEQYDKCMASGDRPIDCCIESGGHDDSGDDEPVHCAAPPGNVESHPSQSQILVPSHPLPGQVYVSPTRPTRATVPSGPVKAGN